jgi:hypothetical protein
VSPTESQLRAALQEGAGRGLDADAIIARAERYRRARRQRITNIAAAAAVVCVFVGGGTWFAVSNSDNEQSGNASGGAALAPDEGHKAPRRQATARPAPRPAPSRPAPSPAASFGTSATAAACPTKARPISVPAAASTGTDLFPEQPSAITACGYVTDARVRHRAVLHGAVAQHVATTLDNGSTTPVGSDNGCPVGSNRGRRILLFAVGTDGARAKPVQVTVRCANVVATNGQVARYLPNLPDALSPLVR